MVVASSGCVVVRRARSGSGACGDCERAPGWATAAGLVGRTALRLGGEDTKSSGSTSVTSGPKRQSVARHIPARRSPRASAARRTSGSSRVTLPDLPSSAPSVEAMLTTLLLLVSRSIAESILTAWSPMIVLRDGSLRSRSSEAAISVRKGSVVADGCGLACE